MATQDLRGQDIINSRDVIARIAELQDEVDAQREDTDTYPDGPDEDVLEELKDLKALQDEAENSCSDWQYGATLIADSYFETYARELAEDISGSELRDAHWPFDHIDWAAAADALKQDHTCVTFAGVDYWVRS